MTLKKINTILPYLILISAFGIYVGPGIRTEHLMIYPFVVLFTIRNLLMRKKMEINYLAIFLIWIMFLLISLSVTFFNNGQFYDVLGDLESFVTPAFLIMMFLFVSEEQTKESIEKKLIESSNILIVMLVLNTFFIIYSMFNDVSSLGALFWGGESTVAHRAMTNGRFSGVFNQPMEAGIAYSIGLICWLYLGHKVNTTTFKYIASLLLMVLGGLVTVSKVFIFGGLGLFFFGILMNEKMRKRILKLTVRVLLFAVPGYLLLFRTWSGLNYLLRFMRPTDGFLTMITAGRLGEDSQQVGYFSEVWSESPVFGRGFGVTPIYDSEHFRFFAIGGTIGLILYAIVILILIYVIFKFIQVNRFKEESKFFSFIVMLIIGAGIGAPTLTLNRSSVFVWVFLGLLFQYFYYQRVESKVEQAEKKNLRRQIIQKIY